MKATSTIAPLLFIGSVFGCSSGSAHPDMFTCEKSVKVISCESPPNKQMLQCVFENVHPSLQIDGFDFTAWAYDKNDVRISSGPITGTGKMHPGQKATALFDIGAAPKKVIICSVDPQGPLSKMLDIQPTGKSSTSQQAKLESPEGTKPDEKGKAVETASITGGWFCDSTGEDGNAKVGFLFNGRQFNYRIGNSMSLTSYDYKASGARGSGTFQEITGKGGGNNNASVPYELSFRSASPEKLVFDLKITAQKGITLSKNECVPLDGNPALKSKP